MRLSCPAPSNTTSAPPTLSPTIKLPSIVILPFAVSSTSDLRNWSPSNPSTVSASNPLPGPSSAVVIIRPRLVPAEFNLNQSFVSSQRTPEFADEPLLTSQPASCVGAPEWFAFNVIILSDKRIVSVST